MSRVLKDIRDLSKDLCRTPSENDDSESLPVFISRVVGPGSRFIRTNGNPYHQRIAKDFFNNHKSDLNVQLQETLQSKRVFSKNKLVPGEYEMKIECLYGRIEFVYEMFDGRKELFEKRRITYHQKKKKNSKDRFEINIRDEHSPATLKVTIKEKKGVLMMRSSRFSFFFQVLSVRHQLVKPGMWQVAKDVKLGEGGCASVYLGMNNLTGNLMAVKICNFGNNMDPLLRKMKLQQLEEEIEVLKILNHENIVRYLGMERKKDEVYVFMDFVSGGSIDWLLTQFTFSESLIQQHTKQMLNGLNYLHDCEIIHRDIKCSNVLYDEAGKIYLTDFGSSIKKYAMELSSDDKKNRKKGIHGTPQFMAPEIWKHRSYSTKSDVWAVGCAIYQMLTGKDPWEEEMAKFGGNPIGFIHYMSRMVDKMKEENNNNNNEEEEEEENLVIICDVEKDLSGISEQLKDFLRLCFQLVPSKRPSVKQLLRHPWFDLVLPSTNSKVEDSKEKKERSEEEEEGEEEEGEEKAGEEERRISLVDRNPEYVNIPKNTDFEDRYESPDFFVSPTSPSSISSDSFLLPENDVSVQFNEEEEEKKKGKEEEEEEEEEVPSEEVIRIEDDKNEMKRKMHSRKSKSETEIMLRLLENKILDFGEWKAVSEQGVKERIMMMKTGKTKEKKPIRIENIRIKSKRGEEQDENDDEEEDEGEVEE